MLDDDQDMADMYLGRRQEEAESKSKPEESARQEFEPPSPSRSAESMEDLEPSDFMGQADSDSETEAPARRVYNTSRFDAPYIKRTTPTKRAQPPPQVCPSTSSHTIHTHACLLPWSLDGIADGQYCVILFTCYTGQTARLPAVVHKRLGRPHAALLVALG